MPQAIMTASVSDYRLVFLVHKFIEKMIGGIIGEMPRVAIIQYATGNCCWRF